MADKISIELTQEEIDDLFKIKWLLGELEKRPFFEVFASDKDGNVVKGSQLTSDVYASKINVRMHDICKKIEAVIKIQNGQS